METEIHSRKNRTLGMLAILATGAGIAAAAWLIVTRPGRGQQNKSIDLLLHQCDKNACTLEKRAQAAG